MIKSGGSNTFFTSRNLNLLWIICSLFVQVPLIAFAINGSYMRYSGDDYCYAGV